MPFNLLSVAYATTPTVISTFFSHVFNHPPADTPFSQLSYHEAVAVIDCFIKYASHHTVEQLQAFTAQHVPNPPWVDTENEKIPEACINDAATHLIEALGPETLKKVGGQRWWQWRTRPLQGEWIEINSGYRHLRRKPLNTMLYIHGGAYYFGSVDTHRSQLQRHARKLHARVFAPRYRIAPQFPFPCAIHDILACYLHLLQLHDQDASSIIFAGDSAGGGLVLSLLTILRDQGLPLPAGAVLISPWVDLCHSFPSITGDLSKDYLPPDGFVHRPSAAWPPPTREELTALTNGTHPTTTSATYTLPATAPSPDVAPHPIPTGSKNVATAINTTSGIDGVTNPLNDQIHMYTTNNLLAHPLVSPVNAPSLGGLCPLLVLVGGGEMLRDEQIYIAHKAANPHRFPANPVHAEGKSKEERERDEEVVKKWNDKPTEVMLQVFDDCCHVTPTLIFTRPAKLMYTSIACFSLWAISSAKGKGKDATTTSATSIASSDSSISTHPSPTASSEDGDIDYTTTHRAHIKTTLTPPPFDQTTHMIRQRISYSGHIYDLPPIPPAPITPKEDDSHPHRYTAPLLHPLTSIGVPGEVPIKMWLKKKQEWDVNYARQLKREKARRAKFHKKLNEARQSNADVPEEENPPPSALYARTNHADEEAKGERLTAKRGSKGPKGLGLRRWDKLGLGHDQRKVKEKKAHKTKEKGAKKAERRSGKNTVVEPVHGGGDGSTRPGGKEK